jgi:hypothetical protein
MPEAYEDIVKTKIKVPILHKTIAYFKQAQKTVTSIDGFDKPWNNLVAREQLQVNATTIKDAQRNLSLSAAGIGELTAFKNLLGFIRDRSDCTCGVFPACECLDEGIQIL